ncbi:hypothetical protein V8C26DRAFT_399711 [Trichoderma gracile]
MVIYWRCDVAWGVTPRGPISFFLLLSIIARFFCMWLVCRGDEMKRLPLGCRQTWIITPLLSLRAWTGRATRQSMML